MPEMQDVTSSQVARIGYDAAAKELHVEWKGGRTSVYSGVPKTTATDAMGSASVGAFLNARVKGSYEHRYL